MSGLFESIRKAFNVPLYQFGLDNSILVALENNDFPTNTQNPFLAGFLLPVDLLPADLAFNEIVTAIYQIDVYYPSSTDSANSDRMVDLIRTRFPIGSDHVWGDYCFSINTITPSPLPVSDGWARTAISLNFDGYTPRIS